MSMKMLFPPPLGFCSSVWSVLHVASQQWGALACCPASAVLGSPAPRCCFVAFFLSVSGLFNTRLLTAFVSWCAVVAVWSLVLFLPPKGVYLSSKRVVWFIARGCIPVLAQFSCLRITEVANMQRHGSMGLAPRMQVPQDAGVCVLAASPGRCLLPTAGDPAALASLRFVDMLHVLVWHSFKTRTNLYHSFSLCRRDHSPCWSLWFCLHFLFTPMHLCTTINRLLPSFPTTVMIILLHFD